MDFFAQISACAHKEMGCCSCKGTKCSQQLESEIRNRLVEAIHGIFMPVLPPCFNCKVKHMPLEYVIQHSEHAMKLAREASIRLILVGLQGFR
jgi:hypothetical protein